MGALADIQCILAMRPFRRGDNAGQILNI